VNRASTPAIVISSLVCALGLTALGDTEAQAGRGQGRNHAGLAHPESHDQLRVLDWTLWNVSKYYVEPNRVDPATMTLAGIEALEGEIAEVLVQPTPDGKTVKVQVGTEVREFPADVEALWDVGPHIRDVFRFVDESAQLTDKERRQAEYAIVESILATLDPHTNLLRPEAFQDMRTSTSGHFGGLGIEVGTRDGAITVIRVLDGNPASKVGLKAGDRIVQIEDESTVTMTLNEAVSRMRGAAGTNVILYVRREGLAKPKRFEITRDIIKLDSVVGDILPGVDKDGKPTKVGLVQIPRNFAQTTGKELRDKLKEFEREGVTAVVLDMRDNPGGLLTAAVEVADAFLSSGTIVSTVGSSSMRDVNRADDRYDFPDVPLVVLVDQGSASATEIVAGALRNLDRAVIVGRRTFGKGSVQVLHDRRVSDEELALKLTIAQYLTPGDISIQSVGVSPDLETQPVYIGKEYVAYYGRKRFDLVREESLASHLRHDTAKAQKITAGPLHFLQPGSVGDGQPERNAARLEEIESADDRAKLLLSDPEIRMARDLALWAPSSRREEILAKLPEFTSKQSQIEDQRIRRSLATKKIDWSAGTAPADGQAASLRVTLGSEQKGNVIRGGQAGVLTLSVTNDGTAPAYRVRAMSDSDYNYFDERELLLGKIDPGQTRTATLKLSVSEHELSRTDRIEFDIVEQYGAPIAAASTTSIDISAEGLPRPQFAYGYQILDDPSIGGEIEGNGDGALQVGERVRMRVWVENTGEGKALESWVHLRNLSGDAMFLHEGRQKIGALPVGKSASVELDFEVKKSVADRGLQIQLTVSDNKIGEYVSEKLNFPVSESGAKWTKASSGVTAIGDLDLYSATGGTGHVIARAKKGTNFRALASSDGWERVSLGKGRLAFVRSKDVKSVKSPRKSGTVEDIYNVSPPQITLADSVTHTDASSIRIGGTGRDHESVRDVYVTVYNPARDLFGKAKKVYYEASPAPEKGALDFAADVPLTPGNNLIEVSVREDDDVIGTKRMWVLRTSGLAEARAADGKIESDGKLSVDAFHNGR
jgi:carboxyl-terminal processing protease